MPDQNPAQRESQFGRWTIYVCPTCGHAGGTDVCAGPRDHHDLISRPAVPVVPCDDAAIERAEARVEAILSPYSRELTPSVLSEQIVEAVLRAAGETP